MLENYHRIGRAITRLFKPFCEVVIHDLETQKIIFVEGNLSKRSIGDHSLLEENFEENLEEVIYPKLNFDGRLIKSVSIPIQKDQKPIALMCINFDVSQFQILQNFAAQTLENTKSPQPISLFKNDWQERIHQFLHHILDKKNLKINQLSNKEKKEIIKLLYEENAFQEKKAADYIAKILDMGRATIFNYLREWKN